MSDVHVMPVGDLIDHDERRDCRCQPEFAAVRPECEDEDEPGDCWRCGGRGLAPVDPPPDAPLVVIHNAVDGRE